MSLKINFISGLYNIIGISQLQYYDIFVLRYILRSIYFCTSARRCCTFFSTDPDDKCWLYCSCMCNISHFFVLYYYDDAATVWRWNLPTKCAPRSPFFWSLGAKWKSPNIGADKKFLKWLLLNEITELYLLGHVVQAFVFCLLSRLHPITWRPVLLYHRPTVVWITNSCFYS